MSTRQTLTAAALSAVLGITAFCPAADPSNTDSPGAPSVPTGPSTPERADRNTPGPNNVPVAVPEAEQRLDKQILNWFGLRPKLGEKGLTFDISLTADESKNLRGGADTNHDVFRHLFDFRVELDTEKAFGWEGGTFSVDFQNQAGRNGSDLYGDAQGFDNIDADGRTQVSELWYEQTVGEHFRVKVGKVDANSEFASLEYATQFINSSFGYSPTITGLPTYPDPAVSLNLFFDPTDWLYLDYGIYDGGDGEPTGNHPPHTLWRGDDDFFHIAEAGVRWKLADDTLHGRLAVGVSYHSSQFERFRGGEQSGAASFYALAEQKLIHTVPSDKTSERGLYAFAQFGTADEEVSDFRQHLGGGLYWVGPYAADNLDSLGLGVTTVFFTDAAGSPYTEDSETDVELFYNFQATEYLSIKPDLQYVIHPGGDEELKDALIATLRVTVAL